MFKTFFPYFGQYKKYAILTPILVIIEVFMNIAIPYLMSLLIDRGILGYSKDQILKIGIILIIATLISLFFWHNFRNYSYSCFCWAGKKSEI